MIDKRKIRVLVVDDSPAFRAALSLALETDLEIHIVGQAADGRAAVEMAHQLRPDVVTMDVMMPVLDGIEASKQILAERPIPILLMSTLARRDEQRMALNALRLGVVDVTNKPVLAGPGGQQGIQQVLRLVKAAADVAVTIQPIATRPMTPIAPPPSSPLSLSPSPSPSPTKPKLKLGPKVELIGRASCRERV